MKILIVDDDRSTRMLLKAFLGRKYEVVEAADGQEAIEVFDREKPDLILIDVTMPVMSGYEAVEIIKQRNGNRFVPIIFLTGLTDDDSLSRCVRSGGDDFLPKPFNRVLLEAKIMSMQRISQMHRVLEDYKTRTDEEIEFSHHIFESMTQRMSVSSVKGVDHFNQSAGHFSGDLFLYDTSPLGKLYALLVDFTGHGLSAAIGSLPTADVFFSMVKRDFKIAKILAEINSKINIIMPTGHFCAAIFICIDPVTRQIDIFNGSMPPILIVDSAGNLTNRVNSSNLALGILPSNLFDPEIISIENIPDTTLIIYSDGVTDAQNDAGELFGDERLHAACQAGEKPFVSIKTALNEFIGDIQQPDDITLVTIKV